MEKFKVKLLNQNVIFRFITIYILINTFINFKLYHLKDTLLRIFL
jgi:hypothetical protein